MIRRDESGVVLVTILVIMALCVTVIVAMTTQSENATRRTGRYLDAGQAWALIAAGEASAISALRDDMQNAPEADGPTESWANIGQSDTKIQHGRFQLEILDETARFNLNTLVEGSPVSRQTLFSIVRAVGLPPEVATRIAAALKGGKLLLGTGDLALRAGLSDTEIGALDAFVTTTTDVNSNVNINSAPELLLGTMLNDPDGTVQIVNFRKTGLITLAVSTEMGIILPAGLTLTSNVFRVSVTATTGDASAKAVAIIRRWRDGDGRAHATVTARKLGGGNVSIAE